MLRGNLTATEELDINAKLPNLDELLEFSVYVNPYWDSMKIGLNPEIPIAGVCIKDAITMLQASHFALHEAYAHQLWYNRHPGESELWGRWFQRFFADDAALRMYAVAEYLAEAIRIMLRISEEDLKPFKKQVTSRQAILGSYLITKLPEHQVAKIADRLRSTPEWKWTRDYRDDWVHEQPPLIEGFGSQFNREPKWKPVEGASIPQRYLPFGVKADSHRYTVDELVNNVQGALFAIVEMTAALVRYYSELLKNEGPGVQ
jgi:hypothetical protein